MTAQRKLAKCERCESEYLKRADRIRTPDYCGIECRRQHQKEARQRNCQVCSVVIHPRVAQLRNGGGKYCSNACAALSRIGVPLTDAHKRNLSRSHIGRTYQKGSANGNYKGRYEVDGYIWLNVDGRRIAEHRAVAEMALGRPLSSSEIVHHKDHNKTNNRVENLQIVSRSEHAKLHYPEILAGERRSMRGSENPAAKLNEKIVRAIRQSNESDASTAKRHGVTPSLISQIRLRRIWRHMP